jgi:hypothetical protein
MVLAVWLIIRGLDAAALRSDVTAESSGRTVATGAG